MSDRCKALQDRRAGAAPAEDLQAHITVAAPSCACMLRLCAQCMHAVHAHLPRARALLVCVAGMAACTGNEAGALLPRRVTPLQGCAGCPSVPKVYHHLKRGPALEAECITGSRVAAYAPAVQGAAPTPLLFMRQRPRSYYSNSSKCTPVALTHTHTTTPADQATAPPLLLLKWQQPHKRQCTHPLLWRPQLLLLLKRQCASLLLKRQQTCLPLKRQFPHLLRDTLASTPAPAVEMAAVFCHGPGPSSYERAC